MSSDVTAIIPVYNGKRYLREALESVFNQTVRPDRLILIDDGSTDGSIKSLDGLVFPIPVTVVTQANAGQSAARNKGISLADTEYVALLDQDDMWYPRHIEVLLEPMRKHPTMGWAYTNCDLVGANATMLTPLLLDACPGTHPKRDRLTCLSEDMFILPGASLIRKRAIDGVGGFDEQLVGYEDDDLFFRMLLAGWDNAYIPEAHSFWRLHGGNTIDSDRMRASRRAYAEKLMNSFSNRPERGEYLVRDCIAPRFIALNMRQYKRGLILDERSCCRAALEDIRQLAPLSRRDPVRSVMMFFMRFPRVLRLPLHVRHLATRIVSLGLKNPQEGST